LSKKKYFLEKKNAKQKHPPNFGKKKKKGEKDPDVKVIAEVENFAVEYSLPCREHRPIPSFFFSVSFILSSQFFFFRAEREVF
jgi:hypothetical protein